MANPTRSNRNQKAINRWTSRIIPVILIGIVAYVTWVIIAHTCVDYLLRSSTSSSYGARPRLATAVVTLYSILLFLISIAYFRLLYTVATNPGYVPRGPQWHALHKRGTRQQRPGWIRRQTRFEDYEEKPQHTSGSGDIETGNLGGFVYGDEVKTSRPKVADEASLVLQDFYGKDVFTCEGNGRPIWCTSCYNWKPDRAHHCSEVGRCVRKMDHFCPWVGGVVGETTFKFFVQFIAWTAIICMFTLIVMAVMISEVRKERKAVDVHWIVTLSLAVLFGLFTLGMSGSSLQFILLNSTTIENLSRRHKVWFLAIHIPRLSAPVTAATVGFSTISYPLAVASSSVPMQGPTKDFAILHSKPGENPFDLGFFKNFKSVMGEHWYDWFLPLRHSPCCNHDQKEGQFSLGDVVKHMREDAGLSSPRGSIQEIRRSQRRKHQPKNSKQGTKTDFSDSPSETERRPVREKKDEQKSEEERSGLNSEINHGDLR